MPGFDLLKKIWFFDGLSDEQLASLKPCCRMKEYEKGQRLFRARDEATHFYILQEGRVELRLETSKASEGDAAVITKIGAKQVFGWSALVHSPIYSLSAFAASEKCKVVAVERKCLLALCEQDSRMGYVLMANLAEVVSSRFHQLEQEFARKKGHGSRY